MEPTLCIGPLWYLTAATVRSHQILDKSYRFQASQVTFLISQSVIHADTEKVEKFSLAVFLQVKSSANIVCDQKHSLVLRETYQWLKQKILKSYYLVFR